MYKVFVCLLIACADLSFAQRDACTISFPKANDLEEPVLLTVDDANGYQFAIPENGKFSLRSHESLVLFCPNAKNVLQNIQQNLATASCVKNEEVRVANQQYEFGDIRCQKPVRGDLKASNIKCGNNRGKVVEIGFKVTSDSWLPLIQVCYDNQHGNTLYTEHTIYGQSILQASKQSKRPVFQSTGVTKGLTPNTVYTQANQAKALAILLRSQDVANRYIHRNSYLARGHLSPDADFLFAPLQFATYFYINTCPQWSTINSGNWKALEGMIRKTAGKHKTPFRVITGTHEILELADDDGHLRSLTLDARGLLPVPKFIWKVLYSDDLKQGIAFISVNNPYVERVTDDLILCPDICSRYNWVSNKWNMLDRGYLYCCDIRDLTKVVPTIPKLNVEGILRA